MTCRFPDLNCESTEKTSRQAARLPEVAFVRFVLFVSLFSAVNYSVENESTTDLFMLQPRQKGHR